MLQAIEVLPAVLLWPKLWSILLWPKLWSVLLCPSLCCSGSVLPSGRANLLSAASDLLCRSVELLCEVQVR